jgi:hypothetical protein
MACIEIKWRSAAPPSSPVLALLSLWVFCDADGIDARVEELRVGEWIGGNFGGMGKVELVLVLSLPGLDRPLVAM